MNNDRINDLLEESIAASNRTTLAVIAIARFFLILISSMLFGGGIAAFGNFTDIFFFVLLGFIFVVIGLVWAALKLDSDILELRLPNANEKSNEDEVSTRREREIGPKDIGWKAWFTYSALTYAEKERWRKKGMPSFEGRSRKKSFDDWLNELPDDR